eukprot:TRINITY_DN14304_c0_g1_i3.p1 TRINITY_DN14304_c0_g1~~TRINITY_DN14304_c0_g1_i3.p1  ORF type:complete len:132 (-),score=31.27 TRINITY_DN14304_c0_g1_i3:27-422(-)
MKQSGLQPDAVTYSALISACAKSNQTEKALEIFAEMKQSGLQANVITYNALISACTKGERIEKALEIFAEMKQSGLQPDVITFGALPFWLQMQQEAPGSEHREVETQPGLDRQMQQGNAPSSKKGGPNKIY